MTTALTVLIVVCLVVGVLMIGMLAIVGLIRWLQRPIEPPECCVEGE